LILLNNQKDKLFSKKVIETFLENEYKSSIKKNDKFSELAFSIAYYLKSFSNIKKLLDYICLIFKHIFDQTLIIIIPLNEKGEIWNENIRISANIEFLQAEIAINSFLKKFNFSKNFKLKEIETFEQDLKNNFKEYNIESEKILSRGKCRGFIYIFNNLISSKTILDDQIFNFIKNCLAIGLENYWLIKTKKRHENIDREISTGAEIQSQLLPDFCPAIFGVDLAAHCRPALQLGGDYFDFMSLKPNFSDKRKEKSKWALVIGDVMGKGIPAGLLMTMLRGMLRAEVLTGLPPDRILHDLNQLAINDLDQSHRFVTLFYSDYDPRTKKLRYSNAAHNPPLLWKNSEQKIIKLDTEGFVLGLQKDAEYKCGEIKLNANDLILYYTDGITDTSNVLGERFDEERLIKTLSKLCKQSYSSQEILNKIFKKLDDFTGENRHLEDDASIVVFQLR
jgi:sigma-B regulation protein RsbU (phosphoserine phosphatase)|tara:strand:- start:254 stop:1603 length:1350 start_codon:yes stop_codon:yes gene_type:complete